MWVDVDVRGALRALRGLPREASRQLREASVRIVKREALRIVGAAVGTDAQAAAAAQSVRPRSDRVPTIAVGGRKRVAPHRWSYAGSIFFGSDAGAVDWKQFPEPSRSRWFWDTLGRDARQVMREWGEAYDDAIKMWRGRD